MSTPPPYERANSFTDWSTNHPEEPQRGQDLDEEFDAIAGAITGTQTNLALIQREDGELANQTVGQDQLKTGLLPYLEQALNVIGPEGPPGPQLPGPPGPAGPPGWPMPWIAGSGIPPREIGLEGQLYLNVDNGDVYQRSDVSWLLVGNIRGPQGTGGGTGVSDHGALTGLSDADHPIAAIAGLQAALDGLAEGIEGALGSDIRTYAQATAPTGLLNAGDLWINTALSNRMYRWNGVEWVDLSDARIALAQADAAAAIDAAAGAQATADGKVVTYFSTQQPGGAGLGVGDLWIDQANSNRLLRWSGTAWVLVRDAGITQAIGAAANAQTTADGKIVTFYQTNLPVGGRVGDLWFDTDDSNHLYRHNGAAWVSARDAQIAAASAAAASAVSQAASAVAIADGKIEVYYQGSSPVGASVGDLWIDTDDNQLYRWNGSAWSSVQDASISAALAGAQNAQDTADGKIVTFYATTAPTATAVGDLWIDTDDANRPYRWNGSNWIDVTPVNDVVQGQVGTLGLRAGAVAQFGAQVKAGVTDAKVDYAGKVLVISGTLSDIVTAIATDGNAPQSIDVRVHGFVEATWAGGEANTAIPDGPPVDFEIELWNVTDAGVGSSTASVPAVRTMNATRTMGGKTVVSDTYQAFSLAATFTLTPQAAAKTWRVRMHAFTGQPLGEVGVLNLRDVRLTFTRFKR